MNIGTEERLWVNLWTLFRIYDSNIRLFSCCLRQYDYDDDILQYSDNNTDMDIFGKFCYCDNKSMEIRSEMKILLSTRLRGFFNDKM